MLAPLDLVEKVDALALGAQPEFMREEIRLLNQEGARMLGASFVQPAVILERGPEQFDVGWLDLEDVKFVMNYLHERINADGSPGAKARSGAWLTPLRETPEQPAALAPPVEHKGGGWTN